MFLFQFHYGTIRKSVSSFDELLPFLYFNSTMVRLEVSSSEIRSGELFEKFQFHYGTIRSLIVSSPFCFSSFSYFNSTMVRLEV